MALAIDERLAERVLAHGPVELFQAYLAQGLIVQVASAERSSLSGGEDNRLVAVEYTEPDGEAAQVVRLIQPYALAELAVEATGGIGRRKEMQGMEPGRICILKKSSNTIWTPRRRSWTSTAGGRTSCSIWRA